MKATTEQTAVSERIEVYNALIGTFAKVQHRGAIRLGMVDSVHVVGDEIMLGFVYGSTSEWCGCLVQPDNVTTALLYNEHIEAWRSALSYYENERTSLANRIRMKYKDDNAQRLSAHYDEVCKWHGKLSA